MGSGIYTVSNYFNDLADTITTMSKKAIDNLFAQAISAYKSGDMLTAHTMSEDILRNAPRHDGANEMLARIYERSGLFRKAMKQLAPTAARMPRQLNIQLMFADFTRRAGYHTDAVKIYERILKKTPDDREVLERFCTSLVMTGERDKAKEIIQPLLQNQQATPTMSVTLTKALVAGDDFENAVAIADNALNRSDLTEGHERRLHRYRGKALEKLGRVDEAFDAYTKASEYGRQPFDRDVCSKDVDDLIAFFTPAWFEKCQNSSIFTDEFVFIVGMPRSGSTLTERIIASHPDAHAIGEHAAMFELVEMVKGDMNLSGAWPSRVFQLASGDLTGLSNYYITETRDDVPSPAKRIIDKALWNTHYVGLIAMLFPNARVIWTRRKVEDTCISCFCENLDPAMVPYSSDLADLGFVHLQTDRLMQHWVDTAPLRIYEMCYEDMIANQEEHSRKLLEFVGLPWHDDCLQFHKKAAPAETLSFEQVRRPIYKTSVGRAEQFDKYLEPLKRELNKK